MALKRKKLGKRDTPPTPVEIELPPRGYKPTKAELEEEFDMPGASMERIRKAFFRPVRVKRKQPGK